EDDPRAAAGPLVDAHDVVDRAGVASREQLHSLAKRRTLGGKGVARQRLVHREPGEVAMLVVDGDGSRLVDEGGKDDRQLDGLELSQIEGLHAVDVELRLLETRFLVQLAPRRVGRYLAGFDVAVHRFPRRGATGVRGALE